MYYEKYLNYLHNSSGWASAEDLVKLPGCLEGRWDQPHQEGGVIIANHAGKLLVDGGDECRHVLVIGATGTGKSRLVIIPSLLYSLMAENKRSFIVFDIKGELEENTRDLAKAKGFKIQRVDFRKPEAGVNWNPFSKINQIYKRGAKYKSKAWKLLEDFIASVFNDGPGSKTDPFWHNISAALFRGICSIILENREELTFAKIMKYVQSIPADKDDDDESQLFQALNKKPANSISKRNIEGFRSGSTQTRGNVLSTFNAYLTHFTARDDIMEMMSSSSSLNFQELGLTPTVLYISLPDDSLALGALQSILLMQMTQDLNECALNNGGCLPVRTEIYLDELCNIHPAIPSMETQLTISRSRGIRYVLAIQSYSQLVGVYGPAAETISANCSTWISLNVSKDDTFRHKLSQLIGDNPLGEKLIPPSNLSKLQYEEGIVIRERTAPYFSQFEDLEKVKQRIKAPDQKISGEADPSLPSVTPGQIDPLVR